MSHDSRIKELLEAKEGEQYQFKEAKESFHFEEAVKCCCALANCGGGQLVFGITDKRPRKVVGSNAFDQPERTRRGLMDKLKVMVDFEQLFDQKNRRILILTVAGHPLGIPVQVEGVAWWYEGDSLIPMPEDIRQKIYMEAGFDFSASICSGAKLSDLDETAIEVFRFKWIEKSGNSRLKSCSNEQLLRDCEVITDEGITYAALILFGKREALGKYLAQSEVIFEYRSKNNAGPANQREEFREGFFGYFDSLWELINLRNDKQHYQEGLFVFDIPTFNERVIREALLNAACHRNYQLGGSIFVRQYPNRLTIESPGGFPNGINVDNILDRQMPRNRRIAQTLAKCGLVERSGQGMNLIYELSIREAKPLPDFTGTDDFWVFITLNGVMIDETLITVIKQIGEENLEYFTTSDYLAVNEVYHGRKIPEKLDASAKKLVELGIVERVGRGKYVISRRLYDAIGKSGTHTRVVGLDKETNKELIIKHIRESGEKGSKFCEFEQVFPSLSPNQIKALLKELRAEKRIFPKGRTSAARWYVHE